MTTSKKEELVQFKRNYDVNEHIKINKKLPQIILPVNKLDMFLNWYNEDLRFLDEIPEAFNEGYLKIETDMVQVDLKEHSKYITSIAKQCQASFREIEQKLTYFIECFKNVTLDFKFKNKDVTIVLYGSDDRIISTIGFTIGPGEAEDLPRYVKDFEDWDSLLNLFNKYCIALFASVMWYITTAAKTTKYFYEHKEPAPSYKKKNIVKLSKYKTISTPIYDFSKVRNVKVDHLVKRRHGWTYSHAFQVHGHYRHYKDGKVVFVNSYIKGKDKEMQEQVITLNPQEL